MDQITFEVTLDYDYEDADEADSIVVPTPSDIERAVTVGLEGLGLSSPTGVDAQQL